MWKLQETLLVSYTESSEFQYLVLETKGIVESYLH